MHPEHSSFTRNYVTQVLNGKLSIMKIFISFSTENSAVAKALEPQINALHPGKVLWRMDMLYLGKNWSADIASQLDSADVLIALAAGTLRQEFAYTGVEIGYFGGSQRHRPLGESGVARVMIPVFLSY